MSFKLSDRQIVEVALMSTGHIFVIGIVGGWLAIIFACVIAFWVLSWLFA